MPLKQVIKHTIYFQTTGQEILEHTFINST